MITGYSQGRAAMNQINVDGLPEQVIHALETMIQTLREEYKYQQPEKYATKEFRPLPTVREKAIGSLSRRDLYEDGR